MSNDYNELEGSQKEKFAVYSYTVGENLFRKIERNLQVIKYIDHKNQTKQQWVVDAIMEKLKQEEDAPIDDLPIERQLNVKIPKRLKEKIEKRVERIKMFRRSFSMKQWLLEAIYEQLDRDEKKKQLLKEVTSSQEKSIR